MLPISEFYSQIRLPAQTVITTHHKPDGDALGSSVALLHFLKKFDHKVTVISPSEIADSFQWLPGIDEVVNFEAASKLATHILSNAEIIFCLDFNDYSRTKGLKPILEASKAKKILIDHHLQPQNYFDYGISDPSKSSCAEMVYDLISEMGCGEKIDHDIARCIYCGVLSDTGSFRFPSVGASVHRLVADLKEKGLNHVPIHEALFDSWSENRLRFLGFLLTQRMELVKGTTCAIISIQQEDIRNFELSVGDTEGLVNYPLSLSKIKIAIMVTDRGEERRLSFRSKEEIDVSAFARKHFEGGGHRNAAGGRSELSLEETLTKLKQLIHEFHID